MLIKYDTKKGTGMETHSALCRMSWYFLFFDLPRRRKVDHHKFGVGHLYERIPLCHVFNKTNHDWRVFVLCLLFVVVVVDLVYPERKFMTQEKEFEREYELGCSRPADCVHQHYNTSSDLPFFLLEQPSVGVL